MLIFLSGNRSLARVHTLNIAFLHTIFTKQENSYHFYNKARNFAALYEKLLFKKLVLGFGSANLVLLLLKAVIIVIALSK